MSGHELIWFGFHGDKPVSFFIMLPELNTIFKHVNGKLNWWGKIKFAYHFYLRPIRKVYGVVFGVVPEHQKKGVEGAMVMAAAKLLQPKNKYDTLEMNWIGDFNPKMLRIVEQVGGKKYRTYHTYRYLFDRTKEFKRYLEIALGSLFELQTQVILSSYKEYINQEKLETIEEQTEELQKMISGFMRSL